MHFKFYGLKKKKITNTISIQKPALKSLLKILTGVKNKILCKQKSGITLFFTPYNDIRMIIVVWKPGGWWQSKSPLNQSRVNLVVFFLDGQYSAHVTFYTG